MASLLPFRATYFPDIAGNPLLYIPGGQPPPSACQAGLFTDAEPSLFLYRQQFSEHTRTGVMGALSDRSRIHRHEHVHPAAVDACRDESQATGLCTSSLFLWTHDRDNALARLLDSDTPPWREHKDIFGCLHQFWRMSNPAWIAAVQHALNGRALFLADGHHRFAANWPLATIQIRTAALRTFAGPSTLDAIEHDALRGILLPPKTTDFRPKLLAGMVMYRHQ